jgi:phage terminase large subunit GpA-like protein
MTLPAHKEDYTWLPAPPPRKFRLLPGEKAVFRAAPEQSAAQWAQGERHIEVSSMPGPYDAEITPYLTGLLELYSLEHLRELYLPGGSQSAKTDFMHTTWGYDAVTDPGPTMIVMQDRNSGVETIQDRLAPMIHGTPSLRRLTTGNPDDISNRRIRLRTGMVTYLAWAQSEGRLASKPCRYGKADEVDLWPDTAWRKFVARFRAYEDSYKIIAACTASVESGRIWTLRTQAQVLIDFWPICPHCKDAHLLDAGNIQWAEGIVDPALLADKGSAWYLCPCCNTPWDEEDRDEAVRTAAALHDPDPKDGAPEIWYGWRPRPGGVPIGKASRVWAHIPPLISRFVPFHKIAGAYLMTLVEPSQANLQYYYNDCLGLPVPEDTEGELTGEKELYGRRCDYGPDGADWQIPMAACVVTADADVQLSRIEAEAVAWGEGHQCWGIEYKVFHGDTSKADVWDQLHDWAQETTYRHESGADLPILRLGVDINYRTDMASLFVKRSRRYLAHIGSHLRGLPLMPRKPSKTKKYKVPFYQLGVDTGKDLLMSWLTVTEPGPRCCHWPQTSGGYDFEYFRMLCAERPKKEKNRKTGKLETVWALREGFLRNEALDVRVGNMAVRQILNPNYERLAAHLAEQAGEKRKPSEVKPAAEARQDKHAIPARTSARPSWRR